MRIHQDRSLLRTRWFKFLRPTRRVDSNVDLNAPLKVLERPNSKANNPRMPLDLNGKVCEVVTGVTVVYPINIFTAVGCDIKSMEARTLVHFADNPRALSEASADPGKDVIPAGGFYTQDTGSALVGKLDGDLVFPWLPENSVQE